MLPKLMFFVLLTATSGLAVVALQNSAASDNHQQVVNRMRVGAGIVPGCLKCATRDANFNAGFFKLKESLHNKSFAKEKDENKEEIEDTDIVEGRGKKGKKGMGKIFMVIAAATKAVMMYIFVHGVAVLAGKALIVAKIALAVATAAALKKSEHKTSYEVVKHPHVTNVQTHSSSVDYDHGNGGNGGYDGGNRRRRRRTHR